MRVTLIAAVAAVAAVTVGVVAARLPADGHTPPAPAAAPVAHAAPAAAPLRVLHAGQTLRVGIRLESPHSRAYAFVARNGRVIVRRADGTGVWASPRVRAARDVVGLRVGAAGNAALVARSGALWSTGTAGSGRTDTVTLSDDGVLTLHTGDLAAWTSRTGSLCTAGGPSKWFVVDISRQLAAMCQHGQQVRVTYVTTGASAIGDATPVGTWHVQAKIRDTTLHPAGGGAYPVKYWVPYDGDYGVHDAHWQKFAYGSPKYRTKGSHGCEHLPAKAMAWFYSWVRVGTQVTVHH